ncbi:MAG: Dabb family protein [Pirellulales bacterium]
MSQLGKTLTIVALFAVGVAGVFAAGQASAKADKAPPLRHVVFFKFKEGTTAETLKTVTDAFAALPSKIDVIKDFEWGTDVGVEGLSKGFTHCFFVTFADAAGRDAYLPHPAHKEFVDLVKPLLEDVCVVDYTPKD